MNIVHPPKKEKEKSTNTKRPNCIGCQHYFITWDAQRPYGCHALNFKSKITPSLVVFQSSGMPCQLFTAKKKTG